MSTATSTHFGCFPCKSVRFSSLEDYRRILNYHCAQRIHVSFMQPVTKDFCNETKRLLNYRNTLHQIKHGLGSIAGFRPTLPRKDKRILSQACAMQLEKTRYLNLPPLFCYADLCGLQQFQKMVCFPVIRLNIKNQTFFTHLFLTIRTVKTGSILTNDFSCKRYATMRRPCPLDGHGVLALFACPD